MKRLSTRDEIEFSRLDTTLTAFAEQIHPLPGVAGAKERAVFVHQLIDSLHRVAYPRRLLERAQSPRRADPDDIAYFDPIKAAAQLASVGQHDEACWLVFLSVHFGKSRRGGWRLVREIYGKLGQGGRWDWQTVSAAPSQMGQWIDAQRNHLGCAGEGGFGNHRKRESLAATGKTIESYVAWIGIAGHRARIDAALESAQGDSRLAFDELYRSMTVFRFGRLARFDYLSMLGKLNLAPIVAGSAYLADSTGPRGGARLLFEGARNAVIKNDVLEARLAALDAVLGVGMQVLEDALCNWQKCTSDYVRFNA